MSKLVDFYKKYIAGLNKYWLVTVIFLVFTFLTGDSNIYNRYKYDEKIRSLENEIERYRKEIEQNQRKIEELQTDKTGLEQFAREEYLMKKPDEDLFIVDEE
ncbi:MAG: septum formation initiator family protein [Tannerella sp.]|jgi:cell division protein FtsB|nr:septum formation initiator family protein [Tannerella sp.]